MNASYVAAIAGVSSALLLAAIARIPAPSNPIMVEQFDSTWRDVMVPLGFKSAQVAAADAPKTIRVIPIAPEPTSTVVPAAERDAPSAKEDPRPEAPPPVTSRVTKPKPTKPYDVCRGKGKRYYNRNRSWRCKR